MFIIGLTGGTGAGKTSALRAIESLGGLPLDCDRIYHDLLENSESLKSELESRFDGVLVDGKIDRKLLGGIVFNDPMALAELNSITHKYTIEAAEEKIAKWESTGGKIAAIDAIALIESGINKKCDIVIAVTAPRETRISRIMLRDSISREQAEMRINAQKPDDFYIENSDYVLKNTFNTSEEFETHCKAFFMKIIEGRAD